MTFDSKIYKKSIPILIETEIMRHIDKSNTNQIGYFHQNIFHYIGGEHWVVPKKGFDIVNSVNNIFVELKNKHNTMNSSSSQKTFMRMQNQLLKEPSSVCMLVEVIAKASQNIPWKVTLDGISTSDNRIRKLSIDKFYEIVTLDKNAFFKLCIILPKVLDDVIEDCNDEISDNTILQEITQLYKEEDIIKTLYILAFKNYEGFNSLV